MLYKFKSKACGDVIMLGPNGDQLLQLIGREPAPSGIIEPGHMALARHRLEAAVAEAEAAAAAAAAGREADGSSDDTAAKAVGLRQRVWPMVQMLQRAEAAREPIVWGV